MRTIEAFIQCKYPDQSLCEDGIYISDHIAAVIDGATSDSTPLINGRKSGLFAKDTLIEALQNNTRVQLLSPQELIAYLSDYLRSETCRYIAPDPENMPRASIIIYNAHSREVICYGDCQCIVDCTLHSGSKKIDTENSELRASYITEAINNGCSIADFLDHDTAREKIIARIRAQHQYENKNCDYGFPVMNGLCVCNDMIRIYPVTSDTPVILATDGYPFLCDTLSASETRLTSLLEEDPLCYRIFKSTKGRLTGQLSFDDRAFWKGK